MFDHYESSRCRRWGGVAVGAIAAGMLIGSIGELADAPIARADAFGQVVDNIQAAETLGQTDLGEAATAFAGGDTLQGLYDTFVGLDDSTVAPEDWVLQGGVDALTGAALPNSVAFDFDDLGGPPANWAAAVSEVTSLSAYGETLLTDAGEAFASGDPSGGLFDSIGVVAVFDVIEPEVLALGLASGL